MKKRYSFFAKWRKQDVEFLNSFNLIKTIKEGYDGFWIEEGDTYEKIMEKFSKKSFLFSKTNQPSEFKVKMSSVTFSKEELDNANYYVLCETGKPKGYPQPKEGYVKEVFNFDECNFIRNNRIQKAPFRIKKPKWEKNQINFSLNWDWDRMFFKKKFYQEVLAPLGLKYIEVLDYSTGKPLNDTIQLDIPISPSRILMENSVYDINKPNCGVKQYSGKILDFFPPFKKVFDFYICYSQEEFDNGYKRIIISKEFCKLLVEHKIIKYNSEHIIPMKSN